MLRIDQLSYWEKQSYFESIDFVIIGAGIVGLSTAIYLNERFQNAKILILERGYLPSGASTKNAGFACFGSPTELRDDLEKMSEDKVWETVSLRYRGLQRLFSLVEENKINYTPCGSWDLIQNSDPLLDKSFISYLNEQTFRITGEKEVYAEDKNCLQISKFKGFSSAYINRIEGSINTELLIQELYKTVISKNIRVLFGIEANHIYNYSSGVSLDTSIGEVSAANVFICTNGFAKQFLDSEDIEPARAQVLITKPIQDLKVQGTFHVDKGYTYFRNIDNRILLGGGRNLSFKEENSTQFENTAVIQNYLTTLLRNKLVPHQDVEIDYFWSGIMGIGKEKGPIVKKVNNNVYCGVRMGGMGVAIGAEVGYLLANKI